MITWIVLIRGINVGGSRSVPMAQLKTLLMDEGYTEVKTYIQSGNAIICHAENNAALHQATIENAMERHFGFRPQVMVITPQELRLITEGNPFPQAEAEPKSLHVYFLAKTPPHPNLALLNDLKSPNEVFVLQERAFYLHAPDGIGRSKLAEKVEKCLGVAATARNWRTVCILRDMILAS